nr:MAG TPA: hypothetical protein [Caudoviricetes sp.]
MNHNLLHRYLTRLITDANSTRAARLPPHTTAKTYSIELPLPVCQYGAPMHAPRSNCKIPDRLSQSGYAEAYRGSLHSFQNHRARVDGFHAAVTFDPDESNAVFLRMALRIRHGIKAIDDLVYGAAHLRLHLVGVVGCVGVLGLAELNALMRLAVAQAVFAAHSLVVDQPEVSHTCYAILAGLHTQAMKTDILDDPQTTVANITQHISALYIMRDNIVFLRKFSFWHPPYTIACGVVKSHMGVKGLYWLKNAAI